ncbi:hypothetical protein NPIL_170081 [Nephila pilipes]|uniref:Uncharacterized protein n=1 Tax=Nephila pilipes TaxID=299642 RepID=A0A8X6JXQ7_NEPPI|nr:hypothetical protein NPIL_170081 [Nephila pilipes]
MKKDASQNFQKLPDERRKKTRRHWESHGQFPVGDNEENQNAYDHVSDGQRSILRDEDIEVEEMLPRKKCFFNRLTVK